MISAQRALLCLMTISHVSLALPVDTGMVLSPSSESDGEPLDGQQLGPYLLRRKVGQGGMGTVYEGEDVRTGRRVAHKLLRQKHAASGALGPRLRKEARALGLIEHPGL